MAGMTEQNLPELEEETGAETGAETGTEEISKNADIAKIKEGLEQIMNILVSKNDVECEEAAGIAKMLLEELGAGKDDDESESVEPSGNGNDMTFDEYVGGGK